MAYVAVYAQELNNQRDMEALFRDHGPEILRAVNEAGRFGFNAAQKILTKDVNFPPGYLTSSGRLNFREARSSTDSAIISARKRPASLATFLTGPHPGFGQRGGVAVQVLRGRGRHMSKAFLMRVKSGKGALGNVGIAMRKEAYDKLAKRRKGPNTRWATMMGTLGTGAAEAGKYEWNGLVMLYGVSVDQALKTHSTDIWQEAFFNLRDSLENIVEGGG